MTNINNHIEKPRLSDISVNHKNMTFIFLYNLLLVKNYENKITSNRCRVANNLNYIKQL